MAAAAAASSSSSPSSGAQPTWVPYQPTRDCSQGLCSIYCPQWCYFVFPPPPPFDIAGPSPDDSSGPAFSPLVIAIIGVLASAFLLVTYYTIISKYCGTFSSIRHRVMGSDAGGAGGGAGHGDGQSRGQEPWNVSPSNGLDEALINKITVCKYKRGDGFVDTTDCSVCLGEFRDGENLRLLPKCSHAFHLQCIDTWLKSHSNCPLCRTNIAFVPTGVVSPEPERRPPGEEGRDGNHEVVVVIDDLESACEEEHHARTDAAEHHKDQAMEDANGIVEIREDGTTQPTRGSSSVDAHRDGRMSIADVLQASMADEMLAARESGLMGGGAGSSRRCHGEHSKDYSRSRASHDAVNPVSMKRSAPSARSCFSNKNCRGKDSVLEI